MGDVVLGPGLSVISNIYGVNESAHYDYNISGPGREDEALRFARALYEKLRANIKLPAGFRASVGVYLRIDDNGCIAALGDGGISVRENSSPSQEIVGQAKAAVVEGFRRSLPLPPRPSWVTPERWMLVQFPNPRDRKRDQRPVTQFPAELAGTHAGRISVGGSTLTLQLECGRTCKLTTTTTERRDKPESTNEAIVAIERIENIEAQARALAYAREHAAESKENPEYAAIHVLLRPYLDGRHRLDKCFDVTTGEYGWQTVCSLAADGGKPGTLLYFGPSLSCGQGFCEYVIYPLAARRAGNTAPGR